MPTKKNITLKVSPAEDPENIKYYTALFENVYRTIQESLFDMEDISKAVSSATCKEYLDFRRSIQNCIFYFDEINNTTLEDYFMNE